MTLKHSFIKPRKIPNNVISHVIWRPPILGCRQLKLQSSPLPFCVVCDAQSLFFCVVLCRLLFVVVFCFVLFCFFVVVFFSFFSIVLSVPSLIYEFDYSFGTSVFKHF